jgi:DNA-binding transcriptional LysR family regulator
MEMKQLHHFMVVAHHRKLLAASEDLHMSQSALTRSIKTLEASLGIPLFEREARGMRLTAFGESLVAHAQVILAQRVAALTELKSIKGGGSGEISIGTDPSSASDILPLAVSQFMADKANIKVSVTEGTMEELMPRVQPGGLDLLFLLLSGPVSDPDLKCELIAEHKLIVVGRAGHPLAKGKAQAAAVAEAKWILSERIMAGDQTVRKFFSRHGVSLRGNSIIASKSIAFAKATVAQSDMLTILPAHAIAAEIHNKDLVLISVPALEHTVHAGIIYPARGTQTPAVTEFIKKLKAIAKTGSGKDGKTRK